MNRAKMREMWQVPRLSLQERDRRWGATRKAMRTQGLGCLIIWGNSTSFDKNLASLRYLTQIGAAGETAFLVFPLEGEPTCIVWGISFVEPWRHIQDWIEDVRFADRTWAECVTERLKELGFERGNIGVVGLSGFSDRDGWISYQMYNEILKSLPYANFVNVTNTIEEIRTIKSEEEIQFIKKAGELSDLALKTMAESARPGVKECEVYGKMAGAMLSHGGEPNAMLLWIAGAEPFPHPHWMATMRPLEQGDIIKIEMHGKYAGYLSHQERTLSIGAPRKEYVEMYRVAMQCYENAMKKLTPGTSLDELQEALRGPVVDAGLSYWELGIHGHGLSSREHPTLIFLPETPGKKGLAYRSVKAGEEGVLEKGMVVGLVIDLINPNWKAGREGVNLGDTILVSETRGRRLTNYDLDLITV